MIYLVIHADSRDSSQPLSTAGAKQAHNLAEKCQRQWKIENVYVCPSRACLETAREFLIQRRQRQGYIRALMTYYLAPRKVAEMPFPRQWSFEEKKNFGFHHTDVDGYLKGTHETPEQFEERVANWFWQDFMENYRDAPIPTLIIVTSDVAAILLRCMMHRTYTPERIREALAHRFPGAVFELGSNGFRLELRSHDAV